MNDRNVSDGYERVQTATTFLDHVLPKIGYRIAYVVNDKKKFNAFFKTNLELAQALIRWDNSGFTVYHACASFTVNQHNNKPHHDFGRTQRNVAAARSLWGDADVGENKPYATAVEAATATATFCKAAAVPFPMVGGSGGALLIFCSFHEGKH